MPRGGRRAGAGRKKGSLAATKSRAIANEAIVRGVKLPLEYMLAVLGDENAPQARRDLMAIQAAPYCHPRLAAVSTSTVNGRDGGGDINITQIYAVPRGARFGSDGSITIEGGATELKPVEPFEPTPPLELTDRTQTAAPFAPPEPLPVVELDTDNVTRLDSFVRRRDDGDDPGPGAA